MTRSLPGLLTAVLLFSLVTGCGPMNSTGDNHHASQIKNLNERWMEAAARRDLGEMVAIYAADAKELLPGREPVVGRDAIREFYRSLIEELPRFSHQFEAHEIILAESTDLAVARGMYQFTPDTLQPDEVQTGKYVGVWRRRDGEWRLLINISNSNAPRAPSP